MTEDSIAKLWVHVDGSSTLAKESNIKSQDLLKIQRWIYDNMDIIYTKWTSNNMGGDYKNK
jgi:hypothetical protein